MFIGLLGEWNDTIWHFSGQQIRRNNPLFQECEQERLGHFVGQKVIIGRWKLTIEKWKEYRYQYINKKTVSKDYLAMLFQQQCRDTYFKNMVSEDVVLAW